MTVHKTIIEILDKPWHELGNSSNNFEKIEWHGIRNLNLEEVEIWEQIYYEAGIIGIYEATKPYAELYIIVFNLFARTNSGILKFYGPRARYEVLDYANNLGIKLPTSISYIDESNKWMYND